MSQNVWATIMPFGLVTLIFYWPKNFFSGTDIIINTCTTYIVDMAPNYKPRELVLDYVIERKRMDDLVHSCTDGRLKDQKVYNVKQTLFVLLNDLHKITV